MSNRIGPADEVVEDKGVKLLIDPKAVLFLIGTEMDWKIGKLSSQFVFNNPNQTSACGCGESVLLTPAKDSAAKDWPPERTSQGKCQATLDVAANSGSVSQITRLRPLRLAA